MAASENVKDKEMDLRLASLLQTAGKTRVFLEENAPYMNGETARALTVGLQRLLAEANSMLATCEEVKLHRDRQAEAAKKAAAKLPKR